MHSRGAYQSEGESLRSGSIVARMVSASTPVASGLICGEPLRGSGMRSAGDGSLGSSRLRTGRLPEPLTAGDFSEMSSSSPMSPREESNEPDDSAGESVADEGVRPGSPGVSMPAMTVNAIVAAAMATVKLKAC